MRWIENWLKCQTQGIMINTKGSWRPQGTQGLISGPILLHILSYELDDWADCTLIKVTDDTRWMMDDTRTRIMSDSFEVLATIQQNLDQQENWTE